jgi:hypothetical protein
VGNYHINKNFTGEWEVFCDYEYLQGDGSWATERHHFPDKFAAAKALTEALKPSFVKVVKYCKTCGACPAQWDALGAYGEDIYIRFRHGYFRAEVDGKIVVQWYDGDDPDNGCMDDEQMKTLCEDVLDFSGAEYCNDYYETGEW